MALDLVHPDAWQRSLPTTGTLAATFKKVGKYFRDQASEQSDSTLHLAPHKFAHKQHISPWPETRKQTGYHIRVSPGPDYRPPGISKPISTKSLTMSIKSASGPGIFQNMVRHQYAADNILQSYDVLETNRGDDGYWVVYIHGGYFRDVKVDSTSFKPTISLVEESDQYASTRKSISGYASINYRLSPHPAYPQDPDEPEYTSRLARWPDQPDDIVAALRRLQHTYPASRRYILVGHSVGATLAFLSTLRCADAGLAQPAAVVGVSGIYDFPAIHKTNPDYRSMTGNAIPEQSWSEASPALYSAEVFAKNWTPKSGKRLVLIAHSEDDELVVLDQPREMMSLLSGEQFEAKYMDLHGAHNEIWEKTELARVIQVSVEALS